MCPTHKLNGFPLISRLSLTSIYCRTSLTPLWTLCIYAKMILLIPLMNNMNLWKNGQCNVGTWPFLWINPLWGERRWTARDLWWTHDSSIPASQHILTLNTNKTTKRGIPAIQGIALDSKTNNTFCYWDPSTVLMGEEWRVCEPLSLWVISCSPRCHLCLASSSCILHTHLSNCSGCFSLYQPHRPRNSSAACHGNKHPSNHGSVTGVATFYRSQKNCSCQGNKSIEECGEQVTLVRSSTGARVLSESYQRVSEWLRSSQGSDCSASEAAASRYLSQPNNGKRPAFWKRQSRLFLEETAAWTLILTRT